MWGVRWKCAVLSSGSTSMAMLRRPSLRLLAAFNESLQRERKRPAEEPRVLAPGKHATCCCHPFFDPIGTKSELCCHMSHNSESPSQSWDLNDKRRHRQRALRRGQPPEPSGARGRQSGAEFGSPPSWVLAPLSVSLDAPRRPQSKLGPRRLPSCNRCLGAPARAACGPRPLSGSRSASSMAPRARARAGRAGRRPASAMTSPTLALGCRASCQWGCSWVAERARGDRTPLHAACALGAGVCLEEPGIATMPSEQRGQRQRPTRPVVLLCVRGANELRGNREEAWCGRKERRQ